MSIRIRTLGAVAVAAAGLALAAPAVASAQAPASAPVSPSTHTGTGGPFKNFDDCEIDRDFVVAHGTHAYGCFMEDNGLWWYQYDF